MYLDFAKNLDLQVCETRVGTQKFNSLKLDTFDMIITSLFIKDKEE